MISPRRRWFAFPLLALCCVFLIIVPKREEASIEAEEDKEEEEDEEESASVADVERMDSFVRSLEREVIFFLETSAVKREFSGAALCAMESAASANPDRAVLVLLPASAAIQQVPSHLRHISNLYVVRTDFSKLADGMPVQGLWHSGRVHGSKFPLVNMSDILRLVVLFRYGGIYFDTDIISLKRVPDDKVNFLIAYHSWEVNNAIARFSKQAHPFLDLAMRRLVKTFNGNLWGTQGPQLLTDTVRRYCNLHEGTGGSSPTLANKECGDHLDILPIKAGYPIPWEDWWDLHDPGAQHKVQKAIKNSLVIHIWNHVHHRDVKSPIILREDQPIYQLFADRCPLTLDAVFKSSVGKPFEM